MSYSYDKFLRPITESDKSIKILDDTNDIKYTIDPFVITNVAAINNILRISLRSLKVILLNFSTKNEAKIALTRLQQQIDTLTTKVPILIDKDIQNYIQNQIDQIGIIVGPTGPQGLTGSIGPQGATGSADRYAATSSTTLETPVVGEVVDLVTQTDLAYSTAQNVVIYSDLPNLYNSDYETDGSYFVGQIDYYDTQTGDMSLVTTFSSGSGTYSFWYLNLSGMEGIEGATGTSGSSGTSGTSGSSGTSGTSGSSGTSGTSGSSGDRYSTTSSDTFTIPEIGFMRDFLVGTSLAYTPSQTVIVSPDTNPTDHFHATIDTYYPLTGSISVTCTEYNELSGQTYSNWKINLSGAVGVPGEQGIQGPTGSPADTTDIDYLMVQSLRVIYNY